MDKTGEARSVKEWILGLFHRKPATPPYVPAPEDEEDDIRFGKVPLSPEDIFQWAIDHDDARCLRYAIRKGIDPTIDNEKAIKRFSMNGNLEAVRTLIPFSGNRSKGLNKALINAAEYGHADCIKELLPHAEPAVFGSEALWASALVQQEESVRILIPFSDIHDAIKRVYSSGKDRDCSPQQMEDAEKLILGVVKEELDRERGTDGKSALTAQNLLTAAAIHGDAEAMRKALASGADHRHHRSFALRTSLSKGHMDCIEQLIPFASPPDDIFDQALIECAGKRNVGMVRFLIPLSDPKRYQSNALRNAIENRDAEITDMLIPVSSTREAIDKIESDAYAFGTHDDGLDAEGAANFLNSRIECLMLKSRIGEGQRPTDKKTI